MSREMETVARFLMIALWALRKVQPRAESPHFVCYLIVVQQVIERVVSALLHDPVEVVHRHAAVATLDTAAAIAPSDSTALPANVAIEPSDSINSTAHPTSATASSAADPAAD